MNTATIFPEDNIIDLECCESGELASILHGQEALALEDAAVRRVWQEEMKDFGLKGKTHRNVAVLMISFVNELDDLDITAEVEKLGCVFKDIFHYQVVKKQLSAKNPPGIQLAKHLIDFVYEHDNGLTLLIVYYAGHGIPGKPGELSLAGCRRPDIKESIENSAAWHRSEHILQDAKSDVLLIFDCCYAGNLIAPPGRSYFSSRSYECIAACGKDSKTALPGPHSFTSALIWALTTLVSEDSKREKFTTLELQTKIMNAPDFPKQQFVPVGECTEPCDQRLILAPLQFTSDSESESPSTSLDNVNNEQLGKYWIDLRLWYPEMPNTEEVRGLAARFKRLMIDNVIKAQRIDCQGLTDVELTRREKENLFFQRWKSFVKHRKESRITISQAPSTNGYDSATEIKNTGRGTSNQFGQGIRLMHRAVAIALLFVSLRVVVWTADRLYRIV